MAIQKTTELQSLLNKNHYETDWKHKSKTAAFKLASYLLALCSILIVISEFSYASDASSYLISVHTTEFRQQHLPLMLLITGLTILYLCVALFKGLLGLRLSLSYHMERKMTDPESLLKSAKTLCSLIPPFLVNFLNVC